MTTTDRAAAVIFIATATGVLGAGGAALALAFGAGDLFVTVATATASTLIVASVMTVTQAIVNIGIVRDARRYQQHVLARWQYAADDQDTPVPPRCAACAQPITGYRGDYTTDEHGRWHLTEIAEPCQCPLAHLQLTGR